MSKAERVYRVVSLIPKGKVSTYGLVATLADVRSPRLVGKILHNNPDPANIPCHRVVNSRGEMAKTFAFGGNLRQAELLEREGIKVINGKINLKDYLWK